ncbi:hypothetical protein LU680_07705 [Pseudomonas monteilii]|uniref:hypothetical protein n=1 Tax=Pseudomonas TaxID=286 RepID=UPI000EFB06BB|nr:MULTISPECIES: hypothetical protein [Pseudomonas]AYO01545.1 hypothetical protein D8767_22455 [Pseudomonas sp. LTGT-11-2Z]MCE0981658.1 hypothetical protein [Pseudomonas monteilii]MDH0023208.1 hypothetical protein [Pseudomonas monteilii]WJN89793.1 hypothetical protein LU680_07705 [Pseudomonas monteilii]WJR46316.1 hypothetical protein LU654_006795 [Pseudomonas monteilii]
MAVVPLKPNSWSLDKAIEQFLADKFEDGQLISHAWLEWALNLPKPSTAKEMVNCQFVILDRVEQFKEALLTQHQIYIVSVRGKGYRIVPPSDQAFIAVDNAMQGVRREFSKCEKVMKHTRLGELDADQIKRHTDAQVKVSAIAGMVGKSKREVFSLFKA